MTGVESGLDTRAMKEKDINARITELLREKETLSEQVKRLIRAEGRLYRYQEALDAQLKEYKDLYDLNRNLNRAEDISRICEYAVEYATRNLDYERAVLFRRIGNNGWYRVAALDGYFDEQEKSAVSELIIDGDESLLSHLSPGIDYLICSQDCQEGGLAEVRAKLRLNEFFLYRLGGTSPPAILAVGNSAENAPFYKTVTNSPPTLLSLGNFVVLISSAIEKQSAHEQQMRAEARYRGIFENALEGIFQTTPSGAFLAANPALARMLGYASPPELLAQVTDIDRQLYVDPNRRSELLKLLEEKDNVEGFETRLYRRDGTIIRVSMTARSVRNDAGHISFYEGTAEDVTARKLAEEERLEHVFFLESLERVEEAIHQTESIDEMSMNVLDAALSIFQSDRAWLLYPCDPDAPSWRVPIERTRPEYPGVLAAGVDIPMTPEIAQRFRDALNSSDPVIEDPKSGHPVPPDMFRQFSVRSLIMTAIYPKMGKPWLFGLHQCSYARIWSGKDIRLFKEISRRLTDSLSSLLLLKDLQESEGRFRTLVENLPVRVFIKNMQSVYVACNPSYAQDLGIRPADIQGKTDYDFHPPDLAAKYRADDMRIMASGRGEEIEEVFVKDSRQHWAQTIKTPLRGAGREVTGILGVFWDITERKQAEDALKESEERYRVITMSALDAIITIDQESTITFANPAAERIFGYTLKELYGNKLLMLMPERFRQKHRAAMKQYVTTRNRGMSWGAIEMPGLHKDGREIPLELTYGEFVKNGQPFFVGFIRDVSARVHAEEKIKYQAYHDLLTGLPNKELFSERLRYELSQMHRLARKLGVLFLDIDQFKNINDSLGHPAGDALIKLVAARLKSSMREFDTIARIGGDEFTIMLPLMNRTEDASKTARKIMNIFKKPFLLEHHELAVTASAGISVYPEDGEDADSLLKNADIALHYAKTQGRNNYKFFNAAINYSTVERITLQSRLRKAVNRSELAVLYQPQRNLKTGAITGAEALVRWRHPELGLLTPIQFIPLAEDTGLIVEIDQWVLRRVCEQLKIWEAAGYGSRFITTNLSASLFQQPGLSKTITKILKQADVNPEQIGIEITETVAMQNTELTVKNVAKLRNMGVRFLIDDFGTGYSSLSYLKKLPVYKLKIDQSFIGNLKGDPDYQAITNAIIAMGHILKMKVVAEGVETEEQFSYLKNFGCDEAQGYLFGKPLPAAEFEEMLKAA